MFARDCANMTFALDPVGDPLGATINFFVRRYYSGASPTPKALFMFQGGPGFSSVAFDGAGPYWNSIDPDVTVYMADNRGIGASSPIGCPDTEAAGFIRPYWFDYTNSTLEQQYTACNAEIAASVSTNAIFYSTHYAALDYVAFMGALRASGTTHISLYCLSYGTFLCNMILLHYELNTLPAFTTPPDAVALDGPVPGNRWKLEDSSSWNSVVAGDNLNACVKYSAACQQHLGLFAHIPRLVMDAIRDGSLPCLAKLPWLTQRRAAKPER